MTIIDFLWNNMAWFLEPLAYLLIGAVILTLVMGFEGKPEILEDETHPIRLIVILGWPVAIVFGLAMGMYLGTVETMDACARKIRRWRSGTIPTRNAYDGGN